MPPKLNLQRATISNEFVDLIIALYAEWMTRNERLIRAGVTNKGFSHFTHSAQRMLPIVKRVSDDRKGLDYEITRLRGLPYTEFVVVTDIDPTYHIADYDEDLDDLAVDEEDYYRREYAKAPKIPWLVGHTKFVTMTNYANRQEVMGRLGCFKIYIPSSIVRSPELGHIHLIPDRNTRSINRHPHHGLTTDGEIMNSSRSPLTYPTINCYGDYSGVIKGMIDEPDFPELFRQLFGHLSTFGYGPPIHLSSLDYDIQSER
jgi:hypothetical protein